MAILTSKVSLQYQQKNSFLKEEVNAESTAVSFLSHVSLSGWVNCGNIRLRCLKLDASDVHPL